MKELKGVDLKRACLVPSSVFASPDEVVRSQRLSVAQKLAVLRRWEFDARRMAGFANDRARSGPSMLESVQRALQRLGADGLPNARTLGREEAATASRSFADDPLVLEPPRRRSLNGGQGALG